ncbi:DNA cytosine methyltransferase [Prevotella sp. LCP21S3_D2]|uniref:DNA cytosine methyltransferase n=1 Tax=Prevotella sp. LCP21S3_D2 TaxID=3438800 RepID=UPI003F94FF5B
MAFISENNLAALIGTSNRTVQTWGKNGLYPLHQQNGAWGFDMEELKSIPEVKAMLQSNWEAESTVTPVRQFNSIELFAGGGGLALGMSLAGFHHVLLNEFETAACKTLKTNKPEWNVIEGDVRHIDFTPLRGKIDFLSGGFPCQAFSYAGKGAGFNDTRGTLFFELARAVKEIQPKVFMGENVKGLISHENGRTFETIKNTIAELGYTLVEPRVLRAIMYQVPQKRERLILIAIRNDIAQNVEFHWPTPYHEVLTLRDALYKSVIYENDVPVSEGAQYPEKKKRVLAMVPQGGDWRNLPEEVAKDYMGGSWLLGGGKTGMARRLSLDEPSLTLTCSPCQKQTERCHPLETRPLSIREYARIQTFPDNWVFQGSMSDKYKQIGNAVPVNLAWAVGRSLIRLFNDIQRIMPENTQNCTEAVREIMHKQSLLEVVKDHNTQTSTVTNKYHELNFLDLFDQYALNSITDNSMVHDDINWEKYGGKPQQAAMVDETKNVLISLVKKDNEKMFLDGSATIYYTGKKFPTSVALNKLFYFMPYIKGKGVRDLFFIKIARLGYRKEGTAEEDRNDLRLVFEVEFVKQLFDDYKPVELKIWQTFTDTTVGKLIKQAYA